MFCGVAGNTARRPAFTARLDWSFASLFSALARLRVAPRPTQHGMPTQRKIRSRASRQVAIGSFSPATSTKFSSIE